MSHNPRFSLSTITNGRLTSTATDEGTTVYSYLFADKVGSITKGSESFSFTYDGTLLTGITQSGMLNQTIATTYNNDFQVASSTYAGQTENYSYDDDGLLTASGAYTLTRDTANGFVTTLTDGTLTQHRSYNGYGEITQVSDDTFTYELSQRDKSGAITQKRETLNGTTETFDYSYDEMGRLTEVKRNNTLVESYTYDPNGNRASATINGTTTTASYTLDDQLVVYGDNAYRYNDDGYLTEKTTPDGTTTYSYGTMGELLSVTTPTKTVSYKHNALNQRVAKLVDGVVVEKYLWADLTTLLAVYDADDTLIQRFEYADQRMPIAMTDTNNTKYYLHYDQVGSLRAVSDSSHNIVKEVSYDTFGNLLTDSNPSFKVPFGFAGGLYDADTKLTRFGYRDYDAYTGKWTAKDPIGFAGGDSNLYGYVLGDPVNLVDPWGLQTAVITNGATTTWTSFGNPFGHSAIAFSNSGIYSFGNSTPFNSSVTNYLLNQSSKRNTLVQIFNTTPEQEAKMKSFLNKLKNKPLEVWPDNCESRTSQALAAGGINTLDTGLPNHLMWQLYLLFSPYTYYIPQGSTSISPIMLDFNP